MGIDLSKIPELISVLGEAYSFAVAKDPKVVDRLAKRAAKKKRRIISSKHVLALCEINKYLLDEIEAFIVGNPTLAQEVIGSLIEAYDAIASGYSCAFVKDKEFYDETKEGGDIEHALQRVKEVDGRKVHIGVEKDEEDEQEEIPI